MSVGELVSIVIAIGGAAVTWGALLTRVKVLEARLNASDTGRLAQGKRIGRLERWRSFVEGYGDASRGRPPSRAIPVVDDASTRTDAGDDE